jgi:hypothetical protein
MSIFEWSSNSIRRFLAPAGAVCLVSAVALGLPYVVLAQETPAVQEESDGAPPTEHVVPAQNLEEVMPPAGLPRLTISNALGGVAHLFPNAAMHQRVHNGLYFGGSPPLLYHSGGSVMTNATIYNIFWVPPTLQNGNPTSMTTAYQNLMKRLATDYPAHGIDNNNTQYFQTIGTVTTYIKNVGANGGFYVDNSAYPASGCTDSATPGACITDAQIRAEIQKVMGIKGWTGGLNHIFMLYTSSGEGSCFDSGSSSCAYTQYCAYHSFISTSPNIIYANMPYGDVTHCQTSGQPSPNNNVPADTVMTAASHEITEAITDPLLNAWSTINGFEIGDMCAYDYGAANTYDSGKANQSWNGHFYLLQTEFDNHSYSLGKGGCVQVGPFSADPTTGL